MSLRLRLSLIVGLTLLLASLLLSALVYTLFVQGQERALRDTLLTNLLRLEGLLATPAAALGEDLLGTGGDFVLQLVSLQDELILPVTDERVLPYHETPTLDTTLGRPLLLAATPWLGQQGNAIGSVRLGLELSEALALRRTLLTNLVTSSGLIVLLMSLLVFWLLQRALRPLARLSAGAQALNPAHPALVPYDGPPDEVAEVAKALHKAVEGIRERQEAERASLAEIAHELAAPLTLVAAHLESLYDEQNTNERLRAARDAAQELLHTSQDLLTLARGEVAQALELSIVDMSHVVRRVVREYPGVTLETCVSCEVAGDPLRLTQLVRNLVRNAVQASGSPEGVMVKLEATLARVRLHVHDEGPGIAPEVLPQVFERYFTRRGGGSGVGLAVAKRIAEAHGGSLGVRSTPGEGSVFSLTLPSLEAQLEP